MYYLRQAFLVVIKEGFLLTGEIKATHQFWKQQNRLPNYHPNRLFNMALGD